VATNFTLWGGLKHKGQDCQEKVEIQFQEICFIKDKSGDKGLKKGMQERTDICIRGGW